MMKKRLAIAAGMAVVAAGLSAQTGGGFGSASGVGGGRAGSAGGLEFQQAGTLGNVVATRSSTVGRTVSSGPLAVVGRPVSATEERKSVQTLGDGTEISTSETNLFYRDSAGRTRVEQVWQGKTAIGILDPVGMYFVDLDPVARTARKAALPADASRGGIAISGGAISKSFGTAGSMSTMVSSTGSTGTGSGVSTSSATSSAGYYPRVAVGRGGGGSVAAGEVRRAEDTMATAGASAGALSRARTTNANANNEELGVQSKNGVLATGTRSTVTIPQGQIGNNRAINIVNEKWYSEDLQMLVKSVNSDPRFGDNIYELTGVSRIEPDPALFQIPVGYTLVDQRSQAGFGARYDATEIMIGSPTTPPPPPPPPVVKQ